MKILISIMIINWLIIGGAVEAYWDGTKETADKIQEQTKATIRLILEDDIQNKKCIFSGKPAVFKVLFGIAY